MQTAGSSTALSTLFTQIFPKGCSVYCEQLSYFLGFTSLRSLGFDIRAGERPAADCTLFYRPSFSVDSEADGINVKNLERVLQEDLGDSKVQDGEFAAAMCTSKKAHVESIFYYQSKLEKT